VRIMQLWRSKISVYTKTTQAGINTSPLSKKGVWFTIDYPKL